MNTKTVIKDASKTFIFKTIEKEIGSMLT